MRAPGWELVALTTDAAATPLDRFVPSGLHVALLAGAEGPGLSDAALTRAHVRVTISMSGRVDSLNVASAVSIALYHISVSTRS